MRRFLALLLLALSAAFAQSVQPTDNPNQINVTPGWLFLNKMHYAGAWSQTTTYNNQDVVTYLGNSYISNGSYNLGVNPTASAIWWTQIGGGGTQGTGTVTSVGLSAPSIFSVGGANPVTTNGTINLSLNAQGANQFLSGPTSGSAQVPGFRSLVAADLPTIAMGGDISGTTGAATVTRINGGSIPLNAPCVSTTAGGQLQSTTCGGPGGGSIQSTTDLIKGDGGGNGIDAGIAVANVMTTATPPLVISQATTFYICPANFTNCVYNGDGGQSAFPSDSNSYTAAQSKGTPWASVAQAKSFLAKAVLYAPVTIQFADTAITTTTASISAGSAGSSITISVSSGSNIANGDILEIEGELFSVTSGAGTTSITATRGWGSSGVGIGTGSTDITYAVAHASGVGVHKLAAGYVYQPNNETFQPSTQGATVSTIFDYGQLNIADNYPNSYLEFKGNISAPWNVVATGASPVNSTAPGIATAIRCLNANCVFHGLSVNYFEYINLIPAKNPSWHSFTASLICSGFSSCFVDHDNSLNEGGQGSVLFGVENQAFGELGPGLNVIDSGIFYTNFQAEGFSHSPAGYETDTIYVGSNACGTCGGAGTKKLSIFYVNEWGHYTRWGPTNITINNFTGSGVLYGAIGGMIDNATNFNFPNGNGSSNSTVTVNGSASGLIYADISQFGYLFDSCGSTGNLCDFAPSNGVTTTNKALLQQINVNLGGVAFFAAKFGGVTNAPTSFSSGKYQFGPFNSSGTLSGTDMWSDRYYKGTTTPCVGITPVSGDGQFCYDWTNNVFKVQMGNNSGVKAYLNTSDAALTSGQLVIGQGNGKTAGADLAGDVTTAGTTTTTVARIDGTTVPTNSAADQVLGTTASATAAWASVPNCGDTAHGLSYSTSSHAFGCANITGSAAAPSFPVDSAQSTAYTVLAGDFSSCKVIPASSGTFSVTLLGTAPTAGQCVWVVNYGTGTVTIARNGLNINGTAGNLTLGAGSATAPTGAFIVSDGSNYTAQVMGPSSTSGATPAGSQYAIQYNGGSGTLGAPSLPTSTYPEVAVQTGAAAPTMMQGMFGAAGNVLAPNAKFVSVKTSHLSSTDTLIYTPPSGRVACVAQAMGYNDSGSTVSTWYPELLVSGTLYELTTTAGITANTSTSLSVGACFGSTVSLESHQSTASVVNFSANLIEFDATSSFIPIVVPITSTSQTIYGPVATGHSAIALQTGFIISGNIIHYAQDSTGASRTLKLYQTTNPGSLVTTDLLDGKTAAVSTNVSFTANTSLQAGDYFVVTADAATGHQLVFGAIVDITNAQ